MNEYLKEKDLDRLILKPSIETYGGAGVMLFERNKDKWFSGETELTETFLLGYRNAFVLQEAVVQHPYMSQFCRTSVNTIRIGIYRSVKDESVNIVGTAMRIGKTGSIVDNGTSGGVLTPLDRKSGKLGNYVCSYNLAQKYDVWNDIDFSKNEFVIPNWDKVLDFAMYIASRIRHCRLFSLDIAITENGNPLLIEHNVNAFSAELFMMCGQVPFGKFTDEIIEYCVQYNKARNSILGAKANG